MHTRPLLVVLLLGASALARADEFSLPAPQVEAFARQLQEALRREDAQQVAALVHFPLRVQAPKRKTRQLSRGQFLQEFGQIFVPAVRQEVLAQDPTDLFQNYQGLMFGNGAVWANAMCTPPAKGPDCPLRVFVINLPAAR